MDIFDKYKEDRVPHELLYILARIGLLIVVNIFSIFASIVLCSGVSTILGIVFGNKNKFITTKLQPFINAPVTTSVVCFVILMIIMLRVAWDDGKRHTAYEKFSMVLIALSSLLMFAVYVIPAIFLEDTKDSLNAAIHHFYKPSLWLGNAIDGDVMICSFVSAGLLAILFMVVYKLSGDRYLKKHPNLLEDF